ncbi:MAG: hypothetical protein HYR51_13210 [Candidatus Rokubacteria bacterium]|nr:hypothetical protein [Candidatus Rokubacteria bacterium]
MSMNVGCPRCHSAGGPDQGDAGSLCSAHALQVLDEIVDELITTMKQQPPLADEDRALD